MFMYDVSLIKNLSEEQIRAAYLYKLEKNLISDVKMHIRNEFPKPEADSMMSDQEFLLAAAERLYDSIFEYEDADIQYCLEDIRVDVNPRIRIFIDMDGTLTRLYDEQNYLDRFNEKGFYENLLPFESAIDAFERLAEEKDFDLYILSATNGEFCEEEKNKWLDKHMPFIPKENRIFMPYTANKLDYIPYGLCPYDFILDDYNVILEKVTEGVPIKAVNNINNKGLYGKKWEQEFLWVYDNPDLFEQLTNLIIRNIGEEIYENY